MLTFDDGYADFYTTAVPEMRRYGFTATDYIVPNLIGRGSFMTWSQVIAADRLGFTIGAHTMNHVSLTAVSTWRAVAEMSQSKQALQQMVGHPVIEFAYPYGSFSWYLADRARAMGFESAASTMPGAVHEPGASVVTPAPPAPVPSGPSRPRFKDYIRPAPALRK